MIDKYKDFKRQDLIDRLGALALEHKELQEQKLEVFEEIERINKLLENMK